MDAKYVTHDDKPGAVGILINSSGDNWGRITFSCHISGKTYRLGTLAPRSKDIDTLAVGAKLVGWEIEDKRPLPDEVKNDD